MTGDNTDENKQNYFKQKFDGLMLDYVNERFEFYKKMDDNPTMKNMILNVLQLSQWHSCIIFNRTQNMQLAVLDWPQNYQPIMDGVMLRQKQVVADHFL